MYKFSSSFLLSVCSPLKSTISWLASHCPWLNVFSEMIKRSLVFFLVASQLSYIYMKNTNFSDLKLEATYILKTTVKWPNSCQYCRIEVRFSVNNLKLSLFTFYVNIIFAFIQNRKSIVKIKIFM